VLAAVLVLHPGLLEVELLVKVDVFAWLVAPILVLFKLKLVFLLLVTEAAQLGL